MDNKIDTKVIIAAILALAVIECFAMSQGINGTFRMIVTGLIAGAAGFAVPSNITEKFIKTK